MTWKDKYYFKVERDCRMCHGRGKSREMVIRCKCGSYYHDLDIMSGLGKLTCGHTAQDMTIESAVACSGCLGTGRVADELSFDTLMDMMRIGGVTLRAGLG